MSLLLLLVTLLSSASSLYVTPPGLYDFFIRQVNATSASIPDYNAYPSNGQCPGCYNWSTSSASGWTAGFFPAVLMKLYNRSIEMGSPNPYLLEEGTKRMSGLAINANNTGTHDVGFMVFTPFGQAYALTGNETARNISIATAHSLAKRFSPVVGCIESWGAYPLPTSGPYLVIVDNMMNLELLWWAATETNNATLLAIATSHADHMIADIFQPFNPGCVWHLVTYDAATGDVTNRSSVPQGLGLDTVWSRGQGWATLGYTIAYRYTGYPRYLQQAQDAADCFLRLTEASAYADTYIPLWDFNATDPKLYGRDSSAAALVADGLIELAWHIQDVSKRTQYLAAAAKILNSLTDPSLPFTFQNREDQSPAFINNGTTSFPDSGIPLSYGDYYLLEASMKWDATPQEMKRALL